MTNKIRISLACCILFGLFLPSVAQNQFSNWYFGDKAGLNFSSVPPTILTNGSLSNLEGTATISDASGNILLYSDGQSLWNKQHQVTPNGSSLNGHPSATQGSVLVQQPGSSTIYYLVSTGAVEQGTISVYYSIIDITLDGGKGDVVNGKKNILLYTGSSEKCAATFHCDGTSIWLAFHDYPGTNYRAYQLTKSGLNTTPVISSVGTNHSVSRHRSGQMKFNRDGSLLANAVRGDAVSESSVDLVEFNRSTGAFTKLRAKLATTDLSYGVEFSPDGKLLYTASGTASAPAGTGKLHQFNLFAGSGSQADIQNSRTLISSHSNIWYCALQLAPNGKIYLSPYNQTALGVVDKPNSLGTSCSFNFTGQALTGRKALLGLPNFISSEKAKNYAFLGKDTSICKGDTLKLDLSTDGATYLWNDNTTTSSKKITSNGTYSISVTKNGCVQTDTISVSITDLFAFKGIGADTSLCHGDSIILSPGISNASYLWSDNTTGSTLTVNASGTYQVKITFNGCTRFDTIQVTVKNPIVVDLGKDTTLCPQESVLIGKVISNARYLWNDLDTNAKRNITGPGKYWVKVTVGGCIGSDTIQVNAKDPIVVDLGKDTSLCPNEATMIGKVIPKAKYLWHDLDTFARRNIVSPGKYWVRVTVEGCVGSDTIVISPASLPPKPNLGNHQSYCEGAFVKLVANTPANVQHRWFDGTTSPTKNILASGSYWIEFMNRCGSTFDTVALNFIPCYPKVFVPNTFSPNGDGLNDSFGPILSDIQDDEYSFCVFNRWGELIFASGPENKKWDGTYQGNRVQMGTYFWMLSIDAPILRKKMSGTITLIY